MKLFAPPESLADAMAWLTTLNSLLGLHVFEFPRNHPRPVLSAIYILILFVLICNALPMYLYVYYAIDKLLKLEYILYEVMMYISMTCILVKLTLGCWYTKTLKSCYKKISEIDKTLKQLGSTITYNREYYLTIGVVTVWFFCNLFICCVIYFYLQKRTTLFSSIYFLLTLSYEATINTTVVLEFSIFVRCLYTRFQLINQLLCLIVSSTTVTNLNCFEMRYGEIPTTFKQQKHSFSFNLSSQLRRSWNSAVTRKKDSGIQFHMPFQLEKQFQEKLRNLKNPQNNNPRVNPQNNNPHVNPHVSIIIENKKRKHQLQTINSPENLTKAIRESELFECLLRQVHLEVCKVSKILSTIFGVQIAWEIGMSIMLLTAMCYNMYIRHFVHISVQDLTYQTVPAVVLFIINVVKFILLSCVCKCTANEGNKSTEIVHMIYGHIADADIQEETQQFGIQILQSPVTFSAFGISLDNRLLTSSLKTVTTYLVIMIQMSNSLESNNTIQFAKNI